MSNLLFLTADDFELRKGTKGNIVCHDISGYSLVLFYSTQCKYCKELIPIFKQLPGTISGCQFGMINVSKNKNIVHMSRNSIAPIEYVPYVVDLPEVDGDLREELGIPENAFVFGRNGGSETFDLDFVNFLDLPDLFLFLDFDLGVSIGV